MNIQWIFEYSMNIWDDTYLLQDWTRTLQFPNLTGALPISLFFFFLGRGVKPYKTFLTPLFSEEQIYCILGTIISCSFDGFVSIVDTMTVYEGATQSKLHCHKLHCPCWTQWRNMPAITGVWIITVLKVFGQRWSSMAQSSARQYLF